MNLLTIQFAGKIAVFVASRISWKLAVLQVKERVRMIQPSVFIKLLGNIEGLSHQGQGCWLLNKQNWKRS
jgi:hypothetical protein